MELIKQASGKTKIKMSKKEWTDMGKKAGWIKQAELPDPRKIPGRSSYDNAAPDDYETPECPVCYGPMKKDRWDDWKCEDENCHGSLNSGPDYEPDNYYDKY